MRTVRCSDRRGYLGGRGQCLPRGVSAQGGVCWGCLTGGVCPGGVCSGGVCPGRGCLPRVVYPNIHRGRHPPVNGMTDRRLWKYYLAATSLRMVFIMHTLIVSWCYVDYRRIDYDKNFRRICFKKSILLMKHYDGRDNFTRSITGSNRGVTVQLVLKGAIRFMDNLNSIHNHHSAMQDIRVFRDK